MHPGPQAVAPASARRRAVLSVALRRFALLGLAAVVIWVAGDTSASAALVP